MQKEIQIEETKPDFKKHTLTCLKSPYTSNYIKYTGRFGISAYEQKHIHSFAQEAGKTLKEKELENEHSVSERVNLCISQ